MPVVSLPCADYVSKSVTLGKFDSQSDYAYHYGQCLALAVALSVFSDDPTVALVMDKDGSLSHAAAYDEETERFFDYDGWWSADEFEENFITGSKSIEYVSPADARARETHLDRLPKQNYRVARIFASMLLGSVS